MLKLLFVVNNPDFLLSHRRNLLVAARQKGLQVHIASPEAATTTELQQQGYHYHRWEVSRKGVRPLQEALAIRKLYQIYKQVKPDIIHHVTIKPIIYGGIAARLAKAPAVVNAISGLGWVYISDSWKAKMLRRIANQGYAISGKHKNSRFIFQNPDDQHQFLQSNLVDSDQACIIPGSGVCMQEFSPLPMPSLETIRIVLAARLLKDKGVLEFVGAARLLRDRFNVKFVLAGDIDPGNPASLTKQEIEQWVSEGLIEYWGYCEDIREVLAKTHVVCLPSYREGMPRVLIEAAACGRPIVTTDTTGCRELVKMNVNGLLVPIKDTTALAAAIDQITQQPNDLAKLGLASRRWVEKRFAETAVLGQTFNLYEAVSK